MIPDGTSLSEHPTITMRRPYIDPSIIRDGLSAIATHNNDGGYRSHCPQYEPVGMDGRNDWFRWHCRECDQRYISMRAEKRQRYYKCPECGALHFVYKGFFDTDRETRPLQPSEVVGPLYHAIGRASGKRVEFYGGGDYIRDKQEGDTFDIQFVYLVTEGGEVLAEPGDISA